MKQPSAVLLLSAATAANTAGVTLPPAGLIGSDPASGSGATGGPGGPIGSGGGGTASTR